MFKVSFPPSLVKDFTQTTITQPISQKMLYSLKSQITISGSVVKVNGEEIKPRKGVLFPWGLHLILKFHQPLQPTLAILFHLKEEQTFFKCLWSSQHRLTKSLRPNSRIIEHLSSPLHLTTMLSKAVLFTWYIVSCYQEKTTRHSRRQKTQFEVLEETLETEWEGCWHYQANNLKQILIC